MKHHQHPKKHNSLTVAMFAMHGQGKAKCVQLSQAKPKHLRTAQQGNYKFHVKVFI